MKILVFGGTRFFGKRLVERLVDSGHDVTIATRGKTSDPFGDRVRRIVLDRSKRDDLFKLVSKESFDLVYDNIGYSPQDALYAIQAFKHSMPRYIFTSSLSVYPNKGRVLGESDFDCTHYETVFGDRDDFDYGQGKKLAEAVFFQKAPFPVAAVRFPIVLGPDDYTKRIQFHLKRIEAGREIGLVNEDAEIGFISSFEAARFLEWIGTETDLTGPINAASEGTISLAELMQLFSDTLGKSAIIEEVTEDEDESPFDIEKSYYLDTSRAKEAGFVFEKLENWLPELVRELANRKDY
ncbi:hypothetical protein MFLO_11335 [Listeria floridensis FSL S10-1187]|uniref:UDP-glucose 4-epimerase n=1 Tax=Listeria floridensis FSL S10-1187 TaxID=1265817 RepID=A0ABP3AWC4_9LIST|nr:NAD-dependent epimerase/dehydratase family protein [Listeria floridensis]EUJ29176.1 hypothetical protein MFLO_11335 [Listeria floridensis FSL S10-1187]